MFSASTREFLNGVRIPVRVACRDAADWPIVLSLWYLFLEDSFYLATQEKALVVGYLARHPECGYEIASDQPPYCGVRGRARAEILPERGAEILPLLIDRYLVDRKSDLARRLLKKIDTEVAIRLTPVSASTWDFTPRMQEFTAHPGSKLCP